MKKIFDEIRIREHQSRRVTLHGDPLVVLGKPIITMTYAFEFVYKDKKNAIIDHFLGTRCVTKSLVGDDKYIFMPINSKDFVKAMISTKFSKKTIRNFVKKPSLTNEANLSRMLYCFEGVKDISYLIDSACEQFYIQNKDAFKTYCYELYNNQVMNNDSSQSL